MSNKRVYCKTLNISHLCIKLQLLNHIGSSFFRLKTVLEFIMSLEYNFVKIIGSILVENGVSII